MPKVKAKKRRYTLTADKPAATDVLKADKPAATDILKSGKAKSGKTIKAGQPRKYINVEKKEEKKVDLDKITLDDIPDQETANKIRKMQLKKIKAKNRSLYGGS